MQSQGGRGAGLASYPVLAQTDLVPGIIAGVSRRDAEDLSDQPQVVVDTISLRREPLLRGVITP